MLNLLARRAALVTVLLAVGASLAVAQPTTAPAAGATAADPADVAAIKQAAKHVWASIGAGDANKAAAQLAGGDPQAAEQVRLFTAAATASQRLRRALEAKFPDDTKNMPMSNDLDPKAIAARVDRQQVTVTGDTATTADGSAFRRVGGAWKMESLVGGDPRAAQVLKAMLGPFTQLINDAAGDVEAGKFATMGEFIASMQQRQQQAMRNARPTTAGNAATRPAAPPAR